MQSASASGDFSLVASDWRRTADVNIIPAMKRLRLTLSFLLAISGSLASAAEPGQHYRLRQGPDVASEIILYPDGRFEYFLAAGALDEQATGRWTRAGKTLRLTTVPKPKPAVFSAGPTEREAGAPFTVKVILPNGRGVALVDLRLTFDKGPPVEGYTQDYGWRLDPADKRMPRSISLAVPMYGLESQPFAIDASKANVFTFILTPNDLGTIDFENVPVTIEADRLIVHRGGSDLNYVAESG
jgi:hypothetical protein